MIKAKDFLTTLFSYIKQPKKRALIKKSLSCKDQYGIEVGGPSKFFGLKGAFPVYLFAKQIDGVNFSKETIWEGRISEGQTYNYYDDKIGKQYIAEATDLKSIPDNTYDFLLSCHSLEHVANPVKALMEWKRVCKYGAMIVLVLPDKLHTFDVDRPYTSFAHLLDDYNKNVGEHDCTHFEEIIKYHDRSKDPGMKSSTEIADLLKNNYSIRVAHHHVFSQELVLDLLKFCGFNITYQQELDPFHLITLASKK